MVERLTMPKPILLCCVLSSFIAVTFACGGCTIKKVVVNPCQGSEKTNVIQFHLNSVSLSSDCNLKPDARVNVTKTVNVLQSKWFFQKGIIKQNGNSDGCKDLEKASKDKDSSDFMKLLGMPDRCPVEKGSKKLNKEANISKYKDKMHFLHGTSTGKLDITHEKGRTCYTFDAVIDCKGERG